MLQPLIKRYGESGDTNEFATELVIAKTRENQLLTSIRTKEGRLKLISWQVQRDGSILPLSDSGDDGPAVTTIDLARRKKIITAYSTASNNLQLASWTVQKDGEIEHVADSGPQPDVVNEIRIAMASNTIFVTVCRTNEDNLKLISWRLKKDGTFQRLDEASIPSQKISEISVQVITNRKQLVTSVGTDMNLLKLYVWNVSSKGKIKVLGDSGFQAGKATMIRSDYLDPHIITSGRAGNGRLKLIAWQISDDGKTITRLSDSGDQAGIINDNALISLSGKLVSAVRTSSDNLKLITWHLGSKGAFTRIGDSGSPTDEVSQVTLSKETITRRNLIATAVQYPVPPRKEPSLEDTMPQAGNMGIVLWVF
ncbi:MAG: hypothetical protein Q6364_05330 [Candidatus Hermodarchaeota archaeon]|nr:hypothetical protein [Candidatus Hermodarchaeota archaeon]